MSQILPPAPTGSPPGSQFWNIWYEKLRALVNNTATSLGWSNLNFSGSKITDIASRLHNDLQTIQGGASSEYYHLTNAQYTALGSMTLNSKSTDPTTSDISAGYAKLYKNTTSNTIKLWVNDSGTLKSVTLT